MSSNHDNPCDFAASFVNSILSGKSDHKTNCSSKKKYDYIIVGAGSAGCILARLLSDNFKKSVLVIDTGIDLRKNANILNPNIVNSWKPLTTDPRYSRSYAVPLFNPFDTISYTEGNVLGGGGAHNYLLAVRGDPTNVYNKIATIVNDPSWSYNSLLPLMKALENYTPDGTTIDTAQRGTGGRISITQQGPPASTDPAAVVIANGIGIPIISDYNDPTNGDIGLSPSQNFVTAGSTARRSYSGLDFLPEDVLDDKGKGRHGRKLKILFKTHCKRVVFDEHKHVKGIEVIFGDDRTNTVFFGADKVILCAGAINSPKILELSGIGDPSVLRPLGIEVIVNNPNVGANLSNQYGPNVFAVSNLQNQQEAFTDLHPYYPADGNRRFQNIITPLGNGLIEFVGNLVQPKTVGSTHIASSDPLNQPILNMPFFADGPVTTPGTDAYAIVSMMKILNQISGGNFTIVTPPPSTFAAGDAALLAYAQSIQGLTMYDHIVSTTRMGTSIHNSVVDNKLNVWGVTGLGVGDLGTSPVENTGNTNYLAYVIAAKKALIEGVMLTTSG